MKGNRSEVITENRSNRLFEKKSKLSLKANEIFTFKKKVFGPNLTILNKGTLRVK